MFKSIPQSFKLESSEFLQLVQGRTGANVKWNRSFKMIIGKIPG